MDTPRKSDMSKNSANLFKQAKEATTQAAQKAIVNIQAVLSKQRMLEDDSQKNDKKTDESYFEYENDINQNDNLELESNSAVSEEVNELMRKQVKERQDKLMNDINLNNHRESVVDSSKKSGQEDPFKPK